MYLRQAQTLAAWQTGPWCNSRNTVAIGVTNVMHMASCRLVRSCALSALAAVAVNADGRHHMQLTRTLPTLIKVVERQLPQGGDTLELYYAVVGLSNMALSARCQVRAVLQTGTQRPAV